MDVELFTPTAINIYQLYYNYSGNLQIRSLGVPGYVNDWKGKQLLAGVATPPSRGIYRLPNTSHIDNTIDMVEHPFLFVSSECNISRDSLRNSGYKLVRSKEKASLVLLPKMQETAAYSYNICIVVDSSMINLFTLGENASKHINKSNIQDIIKTLKTSKFPTIEETKLKVLYDPEELREMPLFSIPKCEEYADLYREQKDEMTFGFETDVVLTPSIEVTPELFSIWDKCDDMNVLACALAQCDWQKYPTTLALYLYSNKCSLRYHVNNSQQYILKQIGYYELYNTGTLKRAVEPDDWNMLQKCKMHRLGVSENGGLLKVKSKINDDLEGVPYRIQVKPMYITEAARYEDLVTAAKNM